VSSEPKSSGQSPAETPKPGSPPPPPDPGPSGDDVGIGRGAGTAKKGELPPPEERGGIKSGGRYKAKP
jgi:hypothetical protein